MTRIFGLGDSMGIAQEIMDRQYALVDTGEAAPPAREMLRLCDLHLRSDAYRPAEDLKTMFPVRLAGSKGRERGVLQFFDGRAAPDGAPEYAAGLEPMVAGPSRNLCHRLLTAFNQSGALPDAAMHALQEDKREWVLNAIRYAGERGQDGQTQFPWHRDWGLLATYPAMNGAGVQYKDGKRTVTYDPPPRAMLVYAGRTLTEMSGRRIPALSHRVLQLSELGRGVLIYYADAPRGLTMPDGRTVGAFMDANLRQIGQIA